MIDSISVDLAIKDNKIEVFPFLVEMDRSKWLSAERIIWTWHSISIDWINDSLITFVKDRLGHDQRYAIDPTKITNELGWTPETSFETGIVKTIRCYLDNQKWVEDITGGDYMKYYERMYGNR